MNLIEPIKNKSIGICNCGLDEINIYVNCDIYPCTWHTGNPIDCLIKNVKFNCIGVKNNE